MIDAQFDAQYRNDVARALERYGREDWHREVNRVHAAILELASGDAQRVKQLVDAACRDYRDVLYWLTFDAQGNPPPLPSLNSDQTIKLPPDIPDHLRQIDITLEVLEADMASEQVVATNPTSEQIKRLVYSLPWDDISFVIVKIDEDNWLHGSGSLKPEDGLSGMCSIEGVQYVTDEAPESLDEIVALLQSFNSKDGRWRTAVKWC